MKQQEHIIQKLELEIQAASEGEASEIKDQISDFLRKEVLPQLEYLLDDLVSEDQRLRFEQLDLDLKLDKWNDAASLIQQLEKQIRRKIDGISTFPVELKTETNGNYTIKNGSNGNGGTEMRFIDQERNYEEVFFEFLKTGNLPWFATKQLFVKLLKAKRWNAMLSSPSFVPAMRKLLSNDKAVLTRFVKQVPVKNSVLLLAKVEVIQSAYTDELIKEIHRFGVEFQNQLFGELIGIWISGYEKVQPHLEQLADPFRTEKQNLDINKNRSFSKWLSLYLNKKIFLKPDAKLKSANTELTLELMAERGQANLYKNGSRNEKPTIISSQNAVSEKEKEPVKFVSTRDEWMVENAGQVLFHPFIRLLFLNLGWVNEQGMIKDEFLAHAVQALHYCNTGADTFFEPDLILEKLLCGMPFHQTLPSACLLTRGMKREATVMVRELIRNWPELKNTSPEGLREGFIQRSGKLTKSESGYKLIVERKVQDVLLEKLHWNISIIKMPWQKELLFVEW